jgi:multidrug efflux system membrane fusion protein
MNRSYALLALPLLAFAAAGCTDAASTPAPTDAPVVVRMAPVTVARVSPAVNATGTLEPKEDLALGFKVGGVVARVLVHEGDHVKAGQLLAALDLGEIDPAVTRARAAAEKAERDAERVRRLYADSVATLQQVQDSGTARDAAKAEYDAAEFNRRHAIVTAPADGVILRRSVEPGEIVGPGMPVVTLGSRAHGQVVRLGVPDRDVVRLALGDAAEVRFDALPERVFRGRVSEIGAAADPATGTYRVEIAVSGADGLAAGLVGTARIQPAARDAVALVPVESLLEADANGATVWTLSPDGVHAVRHAVRLAFVDGDRVAIRSGLEGASAVITQGADRLSAGTRVEVAR